MHNFVCMMQSKIIITARALIKIADCAEQLDVTSSTLQASNTLAMLSTHCVGSLSSKRTKHP